MCLSMSTAQHRTEARTEEAAAPVDSAGPEPGSRLGCSFALSRFRAILEVPLPESRCRCLRNLALAPPGVQGVVEHEARQMLYARAERLDRRPVELRAAEHFARNLHRFLLHERQLMALGDDLAPFIDLFVNVDPYRTDTGATAVERRSKGKCAVFAQIERRIDDDADRPRVRRAIAETAAASIHRAGIHARAAADAF